MMSFLNHSLSVTLLLGWSALGCAPKHAQVQTALQAVEPLRTDNEATFHFLDEGRQPVAHVQVVVFQCSDESCKELTATIPQLVVASIDTGQTNSAVFRLSPQEEEHWFAAYTFAPGYLPRFQTFSLIGQGATFEKEITLDKKEECSSSVSAIRTKNESNPAQPLYRANEVKLEGTLSSAFKFSDSQVYDFGRTDPRYSAWYSGETLVQVNFTKRVVFGDGEVIDVPVSPPTTLDQFDSDMKIVPVIIGGGGDYSFSFTPVSAGEYTATFTTTVRDAKCQKSEPQTFAHHFSVYESPKTRQVNHHPLTIELAPYSKEEGIAISVTDKWNRDPGMHPMHTYTELRNTSTGAVLESTLQNDNASFTSKGTGARLPAGEYKIYVWAQDDYGNEDQEMLHFTVEGPPVPTQLPPGFLIQDGSNPFQGLELEESEPLPFGKDE